MTGLQNGRSPARADYDWRQFARALRAALQRDGRGYRAIADEIGVTFTDLSRGASGQMLSAGKIIALCDWMKVSVRDFYLPPDPPELSPSGGKADRPSGMFARPPELLSRGGAPGCEASGAAREAYDSEIKLLHRVKRETSEVRR